MKIALLAAGAAACTVAQAGPSGGGAKSKPKSTAAKTGCAKQYNKDVWPYLDAPADPWRAVSDGKPIRVALEGTSPASGTGSGRCDAAHDHCFRDCTWMMVQPTTSNEGRIASAFHLDTEGSWINAGSMGNVNPQPGFVAYRTVPATRKNLAAGVYVFAVPDEKDAGGETGGSIDVMPLGAIWDTGVVESIDWDAGLVRLKGRDDPYHLSATRVAVIKYADGAEKVEAIAGVDATTPTAAEVFLPAKRKATASDPWSQVGTDKRPIAAAAPGKLSTLDDECTPATDHCLLPWVWFVDNESLKIHPARWTGKGFVRAADDDSKLDSFRMAYRTRPAKDAEIVVGAKLVVYDSPYGPASQREAHMWTAWVLGKVSAVDTRARTFELDGYSTNYPFTNARTRVLYWLVGEDADKVE